VIVGTHENIGKKGVEIRMRNCCSFFRAIT
jgi:hypothetical protein